MLNKKTVEDLNVKGKKVLKFFKISLNSAKYVRFWYGSCVII